MHLFLIGYRGSGKSTIGRLVAVRMGRPFLDLDEFVESNAGQTIFELFERFGETGFRHRETEALRQVLSKGDSVIALGGGTCEIPVNRELLRASGRGVWLQANTEILAARIAADPGTKTRRPSLTNLDAVSEVQQVLDRRSSNYAACADYSLDTSQMAPNSAAQKILDWWTDADNNS